jgi:hypothetical protein
MSFANQFAISTALVMLVAAVDAAAVVKLEARASGRLQYCCTVTFADDTVLVALPDDGSTGVHEAQNTTLHAAGEFQSALSTPAIGGYSAVLGASDHPETGRHYSMIGGDYVLYQDELTVTSSTLATGTPVTVQFSYALAHTVAAQNSAPTNDSSNYGLARATFTTNVSSYQTGDSFFMSTGDHNHIIYTVTPSDTAAGIFTGSNQVDAFLDSEVGDTIQLSVSVDCDSIAHVTPFGNPLQNAVGSASCGVATAFGATGVQSSASMVGPLAADEVVIESARLSGAAFPPASAATVANAAAGMPPNPLATQVPILTTQGMGVLVTLLVGIALLVGRSRPGARITSCPRPPA